MSAWQLAAVFSSAVVVGGAGVDLLRRGAPRARLMDLPNSRSLHAQPTPRGAGIVIALETLIALGLAAMIAPPATRLELAGYGLGSLLVAGVSLLDDFRGTAIRLRLGVHLIAGVVIGASAVSAVTAPTPVRLLLVFVSIVWVMGLINTYNFMDGIDGLAGTQALIAGLCWALIATIEGTVWLSIVATVVAGGSLGFLFSNWAPARVFLGDVGSAFLGCTFAFFVVAVPRDFDQVIGGVLIMWPMIFDELVTMSRRLVRRENILKAHRSHLYQRLVLSGIPPARVTTIYAVLGVIAAATGLAFWFGGAVWLRSGAFLVLLAASVTVWRLVVIRESACQTAGASKVTI